MTSNIKAKYVIEIKSIGNAKKQDSPESFWATLIIPMKAIIKSRDTIKRISKKRNRTLSNYAQH